MNEKYEIIIKENGEEINRVSTKGFVLMAVKEESIYTLAMVNTLSGFEAVSLMNANEVLVNGMWESCGVTRKEREKICGIARMAKMAVEKGDEK